MNPLESNNNYTDLNNQRKNNLSCDAFIEVANGETFPVHRAVVSAKIPKIESLFNWSNTVVLPEVDGSVLEIILEYIYTDQIKITNSDKQSFGSLAKKFSEMAELLGLNKHQPDTTPHIGTVQEQGVDNNEVTTPEEVMTDAEIPESTLLVSNVASDSERDTVSARPEEPTPARNEQPEVNRSADVASHEPAPVVDFVEIKIEPNEEVANVVAAPVVDGKVETNKNSETDATVRQIPSALTLYKCPHCEMNFISERVLTHHVKTESCRNKYKCPYCKMAFANDLDLKRHFLKSHGSAKPWRFNYNVKPITGVPYFLAQHSKTNAGVQLYKCRFCEASFPSIGSKAVHEKAHTGGGNDEPYKCRHCGLMFSLNAEKIIHELKHTESHVCRYCGLKFSKKGFLVAHEQTMHAAQTMHAVQTMHAEQTMHAAQAIHAQQAMHAKKATLAAQTRHSGVDVSGSVSLLRNRNSS